MNKITVTFATEKALTDTVKCWQRDCASPQEFETLLIEKTTHQEIRVAGIKNDYSACDLSLLV